MIIVFAQIGLFTAKSMGTKKNRFPYGLAIFFLLSQSKKKQPNRKQKQEKQEQNGRKKEYMKVFYLSGSLFIQEQREEHIALSYFRTGIKKEHETKAPCLFEKEVSISPERSKRFRKTPPSFCRKQGAPTRKARLSDPKRALIESKKSASGLFGFLSAP